MSKEKYITVSSNCGYITGDIEAKMDRYILLGRRLLFMSLFGREAEVRAIAANFLENKAVRFCDRANIAEEDQSDFLGNKMFIKNNTCAYSRNQEKYSMSGRKFPMPNNQNVINLIVYDKQSLQDQKLIMSDIKEEEQEKIWNFIEFAYKTTPIPGFAKEEVYRVFKEKYVLQAVSSQGEGNSQSLHKFGFDDKYVAYINYEILHHTNRKFTEEDVQNLIKAISENQISA